MRFGLYYTILFFLAAGSAHGQRYIPQVVLELAQYALDLFAVYTDYSGPSPDAYKTDSLLSLDLNITLGSTSIDVDIDVEVSSTCTDSFWLEDIAHQGIAAFNANPSDYQVFRNVKNFGARGDGKTDDTVAINKAIALGNRCGIDESCRATTTTPAVVYFPAGVYMINSSIIDLYYTMLIGNPNCMPVIRAFPTFTGGLGLIDANPYKPDNAGLTFRAINNFWREIKNIVIDMTLVPASSAVTGVHWPTGQATNLQNVVFEMSKANGTQHQGIFIEEGSGGFMSDLVFNGGRYGGNWGNQQFTMRNLTFNNVGTAINQIWDWGWTYKNINIINCSVGFNMSNGAPDAITVGSITLVDSTISDTPVGILTGRGAGTGPLAGGSLILENVNFKNVPVAIQGPEGSRLSGVSYVAGWSEGYAHTSDGISVTRGEMTPVTRPTSLLQADGKYYERSKPSYAHLPVSAFLSCRSVGATGDGRTDDSDALQNAINMAKYQNKILYLDHGNYRVTKTIYIPAGSKVVGEALSVIMSSGSFFNDMEDPQPVFQIGKPGEVGSVELSEFIVSTVGQQKGAILIEYNLASPAGTPSGLWDVHTRIGGFQGSELTITECLKQNTTITSANLDQDCISGFMHFHITKPSAGLYLENTWFWTSDVDIERYDLDRISVYTGRGLLDESSNGPVWMVGTGVEHNQLYEYQYANTRNVWAGQVQTESAYYQPNPNATIPFPAVPSLGDPTFPSTDVFDQNATIPSANGWGLRIVNSSDILIYGAGLYSFFSNYSLSCSDQGNGSSCQLRMVSIEDSRDITLYNSNTVGTRFPITVDGQDVVRYDEVANGFVQTVAVFKSDD